MTEKDQGVQKSGSPDGGADQDAAGGGADGISARGDGGDTSGTGGGRQPRKKRQGSFWRELPILVGIALVLALIIKTFAVQAFYIPSQSMEDTLLVGDRVLVSKIVYHTRDVERGDVVVFNGLDSWDPEVEVSEPTNPVGRALQWVARAFGVAPNEKDYIKRVIGLPGDRVRCCDGRGNVTVNDQPVDEDYLYPGDPPSDRQFDATVPEGRLWVMGDHRSVSFDSRQHLGDPGAGTIPEDQVIGRAFVVVWPPASVKTLPTPATFDGAASTTGPTTGTPEAPAVIPMLIGLVCAFPTRVTRGAPWRRGQRASS